MGLDGFLQFIRKKHPSVIREEHISLYTHKVVFLDIASYMYKYICMYKYK